jgi:FOG: Glucan-binding domain (YG repeat)
MKSDLLKKIIAATVITSSIGTLVPISAAAIDFYAWQQQHGQSDGKWTQSGGKWYFYDYSGVLQTGWIYDKGQWYYADSYGVMQTGVIQVNGIYIYYQIQVQCKQDMQL